MDDPMYIQIDDNGYGMIENSSVYKSSFHVRDNGWYQKYKEYIVKEDLIKGGDFVDIVTFNSTGYQLDANKMEQIIEPYQMEENCIV